MKPNLDRTPGILLGLIAVVSLSACGGGEPADEPTDTGSTPEDRAAAVESRILASIQVEGRPEAAFTLTERMEHYGVPGVSVAVMNGGRIEWARGYGVASVETGAPVTERTRFQAASISKPVAAVAALQLVEEGLVDLDTDVNEYLTSWQVPPSDASNGEPVTLRRLLTHSAGLTVHGFPGYAAGEPVPTVIQVLDGSGPANTDPVRVDLEPGSEWRYSGGGYTVMQQLVEDVRGQPFAEVMRERVLDPAGMAGSTYEQPLPEGLRAQAATGYRSSGEPVTGNWHTYPEMAAAGLWTTPSDLLRYAAQIQQARGGEPDRVLSKATVDEMLTVNRDGWGLGPGLRPEPDGLRFSHGGANEGFRATFVAFADEGRGAAIMTNSDAGGALASEILLGIAEVYGWAAPRPRTIREHPMTESEIEGIVGRYRVENPPPDIPVEVLRDGDGLVLSTGGFTPDARLIRTGETSFVQWETGREIEVEWDERGRVVAMEGDGVRVVRVEAE